MSTGTPTSWAVTPPGFPLLVKLVGMLSTLFLFRKERREETSVLGWCQFCFSRTFYQWPTLLSYLAEDT